MRNEEDRASLLRRFQAKALETILCGLLVLIVLITFTQVLFRYLFHLSLGWTEELARFIFLWLAALTSAYAFKLRAHFALRFLVDRISPGIRKGLNTLVAVCVCGFLGIFTWKAVAYTLSVASQTAPSTRLPMAVPYSSAVVGGALMLYYVIRNWWEDMNTPLENKVERE